VSGAARFVIAIVVLIVALPTSVAWGIERSAGAERHDVKLSVRAATAPKPVLDIDFEYVGKTSIRIYKSDLPWGIRRSVVLVAMCLNGAQTLIPELEYIDDPTPDIVTIEPGQQFHGTINLEERFTTLDGCLKANDALVFWSYQLSPIEAAPIARVSGGIVVPKR
jgi:hypothetical protein